MRAEFRRVTLTIILQGQREAWSAYQHYRTLLAQGAPHPRPLRSAPPHLSHFPPSQRLLNSAVRFLSSSIPIRQSSLIRLGPPSLGIPQSQITHVWTLALSLLARHGPSLRQRLRFGLSSATLLGPEFHPGPVTPPRPPPPNNTGDSSLVPTHLEGTDLHLSARLTALPSLWSLISPSLTTAFDTQSMSTKEIYYFVRQLAATPLAFLPLRIANGYWSAILLEQRRSSSGRAILYNPCHPHHKRHLHDFFHRLTHWSGKHIPHWPRSWKLLPLPRPDPAPRADTSANWIACLARTLVHLPHLEVLPLLPLTLPPSTLPIALPPAITAHPRPRGHKRHRPSSHPSIPSSTPHPRRRTNKRRATGSPPTSPASHPTNPTATSPPPTSRRKRTSSSQAATPPPKRRRSSSNSTSFYPLVLRFPHLDDDALLHNGVSLCGLFSHSLIILPHGSYSIFPSFTDPLTPNLILTHTRNAPPDPSPSASPPPRLLALLNQLLPSPPWRHRPAPPPLWRSTPRPFPHASAPAVLWPLYPLDRARARWLLNPRSRDSLPPAPFDASSLAPSTRLASSILDRLASLLSSRSPRPFTTFEPSTTYEKIRFRAAKVTQRDSTQWSRFHMAFTRRLQAHRHVLIPCATSLAQKDTTSRHPPASHWILARLQLDPSSTLHHLWIFNSAQRHCSSLVSDTLLPFLRSCTPHTPWTTHIADLPQQTNATDCGIHVATEMIRWGYDTDASMAPDDMRTRLCSLLVAPAGLFPWHTPDPSGLQAPTHPDMERTSP